MNLKLNGISVTVSEQAIEQLVLERLRANGVDHDQVESTNIIPRISTDDSLLGGIVAGIARGREGLFDGRDYLLIVGAEYDGTLAWQKANEWAQGLSTLDHSDWTLPTRKEQALLFANVSELFKPEWYWSQEQRAGDSDHAWVQDFSNGHQYHSRKDDCCRVRAVRRVPIR